MAQKRAATVRLDQGLVARASAAVKKRFRDGYSMSAEQALETPSVWASTGAMSLDRICSGRNPGGFPLGPTQGRVVHIAGEWACGKSVLLDHGFKATQDLGGLCLCSETEGSRDTHFATAIKLDLSRLEIQRPATIEELVDMGLTWHDEIRRTKEGATIPILWGLDSIDSTEAEKSASKGMSEGGGWHFGGGRSEALGAGLRKIVNRTARYPTTFVMLNQTRDNVGVMFGPKKRTSGGNAPHFYCVTPETRVLTSDLRWVPAAKLLLGDTLLGFDDLPSGRWTKRKTRRAQVEHTGTIYRQVLRLELADGSAVRASAEHPWLVTRGARAGRRQVWMTTRAISQAVAQGRAISLLRFLRPWQEESSYDAGYLAGMLDAEGHVHFTKPAPPKYCGGALAIGFAQQKGIVLDLVEGLLTERGFQYSKTVTSSPHVHQLLIRGSWADRLALLGSVRPKRLIEKFDGRVRADLFQMALDAMEYPGVVRVVDEGRQKVIALQTSTSTYFAEGFGAHNSSLEVMLSPSPLGLVRAPSLMRPLSPETAKRLGLQYAKDTGRVQGRWIRAKVTKTKLGTTMMQEADFFIDFRRGISRWGGLLQALLRDGIVEYMPDQAGIRHRTLDGELLEFSGTQAWLDWLAAHLEELGPRDLDAP